jgi:polyhydroxyalkanoate synthesis regulator phasin
MKRIPRSLGRVAAAAGAVVVLGGAAVGIAAAQTQPSATPTAQSNYQKFIDALAQKLGVSSQTLEQDITSARQSTGMPANGGFPGRGGPRPGGPRGGFGPGLDFQVVAQTLSISTDQLRTELAGKSLAQVAQAHGKTGGDVATALKDAANKRIDQAVSSGRLTQDQGNTQKTNLGQRIDNLVNQVTPQGGPGGPGRGGPGFGFGPGIIQQGMNVAAQTLGISADQLRTELAGKSLAQVAQAHGKDGGAVATALKDAANKQIDQAVSSGRLTQDQGNTQKTNIGQRIDQLVNQVMPQGGPGRRGPGGTTGQPQQQDATGA